MSELRWEDTGIGGPQPYKCLLLDYAFSEHIEKPTTFEVKELLARAPAIPGYRVADVACRKVRVSAEAISALPPGFRDSMVVRISSMGVLVAEVPVCALSWLALTAPLQAPFTVEPVHGDGAVFWFALVFRYDDARATPFEQKEGTA